MRTDLLRILMCPYCGGTLEMSPPTTSTGSEIEFGILTCPCGEFPVLAGIPIFKREGRLDLMQDTTERVLSSGPPVSVLVEMIRAGEQERALLLVFGLPLRGSRRLLRFVRALPGRFRDPLEKVFGRVWLGRPGTVETLLTRSTATALDAFRLYYTRSGRGELYNHFGFRFGQPRHLSALALAALLPVSELPILDLACGPGHLLHYWASRHPGHPLVGLDRQFFELYVAKRWIAPSVDYVCCEADGTLPFRAGSFGGIFCSDAFHYFLRKVQSTLEMRRVVDKAGVVVLTRVGNAEIEPHEGYELDPEGYLRLFDGMERRMIADRALLDRYLRKLGPALRDTASPRDLAREKWISLVAAGTGSLLRDYGEFDLFPHAFGRLGINPLYRDSGPDALGNRTLEFEFPSEWYEFENADSRTYMPRRVVLTRGDSEDLERGIASDRVRELVRQCVVLGLPERYC